MKLRFYMKKNKLLTTTIGSFPKPKYIPIRDWFDSARDQSGMNCPKVTSDQTNYLLSNKTNDEHLFRKAISEVIRLQVELGIDIPTDGEMRRENYIHYHCRHLNGFDFHKLEHRVLRDGAYETNLPAIRSKISHSGNFYSAQEFSFNQSVTDKPVKFTIPGPLTIMDTSADCFYNDRIKLNYDLAETVNKEILALVEKGCKFIQIDEPLFARQVNDAETFGFEGIERCFHKVPKDVKKIIHICCGYPDHLDDENYKKADPKCYIHLSKSLELLQIDQVSLEDAHCCNDLSLLELFTNKTIIWGALDVSRSRVETKDEVVNRISKVLEHIDRERLVISPDCGLGLLDTSIAMKKLKIMCESVSII